MKFRWWQQRQTCAVGLASICGVKGCSWYIFIYRPHTYCGLSLSLPPRVKSHYADKLHFQELAHSFFSRRIEIELFCTLIRSIHPPRRERERGIQIGSFIKLVFAGSRSLVIIYANALIAEQWFIGFVQRVRCFKKREKDTSSQKRRER